MARRAPNPEKAEGSHRPSAYEPDQQAGSEDQNDEKFDAGWSSLVARRAPNPEKAGGSHRPSAYEPDQEADSVERIDEKFDAG